MTMGQVMGTTLPGGSAGTIQRPPVPAMGQTKPGQGVRSHSPGGMIGMQGNRLAFPGGQQQHCFVVGPPGPSPNSQQQNMLVPNANLSPFGAQGGKPGMGNAANLAGSQFINANGPNALQTAQQANQFNEIMKARMAQSTNSMVSPQAPTQFGGGNQMQGNSVFNSMPNARNITSASMDAMSGLVPVPSPSPSLTQNGPIPVTTPNPPSVPSLLQQPPPEPTPPPSLASPSHNCAPSQQQQHHAPPSHPMGKGGMMPTNRSQATGNSSFTSQMAALEAASRSRVAASSAAIWGSNT